MAKTPGKTRRRVFARADRKYWKQHVEKLLSEYSDTQNGRTAVLRILISLFLSCFNFFPRSHLAICHV